MRSAKRSDPPASRHSSAPDPALAAEAAEDRPRASMIALPRCWTVLANSPWSQAWSPMTSSAGLPSIRVFR